MYSTRCASIVRCSTIYSTLPLSLCPSVVRRPGPSQGCIAPPLIVKPTLFTCELEEATMVSPNPHPDVEYAMPDANRYCSIKIYNVCEYFGRLQFKNCTTRS